MKERTLSSRVREYRRTHGSMASVQIVPQLQTAGTWRERASREVTIVIPTFRNVRYLTAAFQSALNAPAASVIVVEDGCGNAERQVIGRFEEQFGPRLR